jgi:hypothetical protein
MPTCNSCGGEIEFRYMGGRPTPIHLDGRWCPGYRAQPAAPKPFSTTASYVNPNAHCPVCGERVFFYQSPHGGRVFFDNLGWPWPKHGCTDNPRSQVGHVRTIAETVHRPFRSANDEPLDVYELSSIKVTNGIVQMRFSKVGQNLTFSASVPGSSLREQGITTNDLKSAPSFVVRTHDAYRIIEFISVRKRCILKFSATRSRSA